MKEEKKKSTDGIFRSKKSLLLQERLKKAKNQWDVRKKAELEKKAKFNQD